MFQILKNPNYDFMGRKYLWLGFSVALVLLSVVVLGVKGMKKGIEFTGGTELRVKFATAPDLADIRSRLTQAGLTNHLVTTIGKPEENEVYVRLATTAGPREEDLAPRVRDALRTSDWEALINQGQTDINTADEAHFRRLLETGPGLTSEAIARVAGAIVEVREERAILRSLDELAGAPGVTPENLDFLRKRTFAGPFRVLSQSYIGPAIGGELIQKAWLAVLGSLGGMLAYIGIRFRSLEWGVAAVLALVHDTFVTVGLFSLSNQELSLPVVASFLTLMGYSVNDTVVVFDRIRENLRLRGQMDFEKLINLSLNQTLSRTIITAGLTWITTLAIFLFGGEALKSFSFVLTVGIVVGTYSSISIASPFLLLWRQYRQGKKGAAGESAAGARATGGGKPAAARKVRQNRA